MSERSEESVSVIKIKSEERTIRVGGRKGEGMEIKRRMRKRYGEMTRKGRVERTGEKRREEDRREEEWRGQERRGVERREEERRGVERGWGTAL